MQSQTWRWVLGIIYIVAVALIWIVASFVVQSVVDEGVSPFLITYICNSLFVVYIPIVEIGRCLEVSVWKFWFQHAKEHRQIPQLQLRASEKLNLLQDNALDQGLDHYHIKSASIPQIPPTASPDGISESEEGLLEGEPLMKGMPESINETENLDDLTIMKEVDKKGRWTRTETAKISLLICPFWFLAQLTFNLSLKYTTVTVSFASNLCFGYYCATWSFYAVFDFKWEWMKPFSLQWKWLIELCKICISTILGWGSELEGSSFQCYSFVSSTICFVSQTQF